MPRNSKDAKEFESAIRRHSSKGTIPDTLTLGSTSRASAAPTTPEGRKKPSRPSLTPSAVSAHVDVSESTFLAESDLLFDEKEETTLDAKTIQDKYNIANNVYRSFKPIVYLLKALGRWPLTSSQHPDGTREFHWSWRHPGAIYYMIVTIVVIYTLIMGSWSMMAIIMNVKIGSKGPEDSNKVKRFHYERTILQRHMATFVVLWTSLIHCVIVSLTLISRRKYMAFYFTFWTRTMSTMQMNVGQGSFRWMMVMVLCYVSSILALVILSATNVGPSTVTAPTLFGILMFREYLGPLYHLKKIEVWNASTTSTTLITSTTSITSTTTTLAPNTTTTTLEPNSSTEIPGPIFRYDLVENSPAGRHAINILGGIFLLIVLSASKVYMFVFIYVCKLLKNGFAQWNARAYASVLKGAKQPQKPESRTTFVLLFRDHCLLLDLMDGTDQLFATILESYFILQVLSICGEIYFFIRTARHGDDLADSEEHNYFTRRLDWIPAMVVFAQSLMLLMVVTLSASEVGEEAMAGFEILRRRTLIGRKTNDELYFLLTMFASYTAYKKIELSAGGYFYLNKEFLIGVISTIVSYFIIVYQFQPVMDYRYDPLETNSTKEFKREVLAKFLTRIERIRVYPNP